MSANDFGFSTIEDAPSTERDATRIIGGLGGRPPVPPPTVNDNVIFAARTKAIRELYAAGDMEGALLLASIVRREAGFEESAGERTVEVDLLFSTPTSVIAY